MSIVMHVKETFHCPHVLCFLKEKRKKRNTSIATSYHFDKVLNCALATVKKERYAVSKIF